MKAVLTRMSLSSPHTAWCACICVCCSLPVQHLHTSFNNYLDVFITLLFLSLIFFFSWSLIIHTCTHTHTHTSLLSIYNIQLLCCFSSFLLLHIESVKDEQIEDRKTKKNRNFVIQLAISLIRRSSCVTWERGKLV